VLDRGLNPPTVRGGGFDVAFAKLLWPLVGDRCRRSFADSFVSHFKGEMQ